MAQPPHWAEVAALEHFVARGWTLVERNYRLKMAEIDLVMRDGPTLVFVEVRQRSSDRWGGAAASIDRRKLRRLEHAARHFALARLGDPDVPMRLDAVLVQGRRGRCTLTHVPDIG